MGFLDFFHRPDFFPPFALSYKSKKIFFNKNPLNYYSLKVTKFYCDSVKNESARTKKNYRDGRQPPRPPACWGLTIVNELLS